MPLESGNWIALPWADFIKLTREHEAAMEIMFFCQKTGSRYLCTKLFLLLLILLHDRIMQVQRRIWHMTNDMPIDKEAGSFSARLVHYDLLRIISVFFMMMIHVVARSWYAAPVGSFLWQCINVYDSMARFCVPIFVMISGVFFLDPDKEIKISTVYGKYILRIAVAFLLWSFFYIVQTDISGILAGGSFNVISIVKRIIAGNYHLWFLYMLAGLYILVPFLKKITESKRLMEYYLLLWFVLSILIPTLKNVPGLAIISTVTNKFSIQFAAGYTGYFIAGYYLNKYKLDTRLEWAAYALGAIGTIATLLLTAGLSLDKGEPVGAYYSYMTPNVMLAAFAIFVFFSQRVSKLTMSDKLKQRIILLSSCSFGMYLVHDFFNIIFRSLGFTVMAFNPVFSIPLITAAVFFESLCVILVLRKIPLARKYCM
jgi:surface polysaccharide O-acyltransferase-like enzyme